MQPTIKTERIDLPSYHLQQQQIQLQQQRVQQQQTMAPQSNTAPSKTSVQPVAQSAKTNTTQNIESQPDFQSIKGVFGWTAIDNVNIPYILRADKQFVSVRIVEMKLLSKYPNTYPDDLGKHAPLTSFFITTNEAKLLNEINLQHCGGEYGKKEFGTKELIVLLSDFIRFYDLVKRTFPDAAAARRQAMETAGWLQIKNTVTPYVSRNDGGKYVPLSVIQYAAGLLTNERVTGLSPTKRECDLLNEACKAAGVEFVFSDTTTRLINIGDILKLSPVDITELPSSNPLKHATYMELPTSNNRAFDKRPSENHQTQPKTMPQPKTSQAYMFQQGPHSNAQRVPKSANNQINSVPQFPHQTGYPALEGMVDSRLTDIMKIHNNTLNSRPIISQGPPNIRLGQVPLNQMSSSVNPVMQYYINMQNAQQNQIHRSSLAMNQPKVVPVPLNFNPEMSNSRSPGASSSTSPRSRPPSQPRPSPGSRPPSASPLSPTGQFSPSHSRGIVMSPHSDSVSSSMQHHLSTGNTSPAIQQMQNMFPQQFTAPKHGVGVNSVSSSGETNNVSGQQGKTYQDYSLKQQLHYQSLQTNHANQSANQELPGLFSPTGINVNCLNRLNALGSNDVSDKSPPIPPLTVISEPVKTSIAKSHSPPPKAQPLPTTISAAKPQGTLVNSIKGAWLNNKSISCLYLENQGERNGQYCLVEAVCKLYFNGCSVNEFLFALENVLNVPLVTCNELEEKAFIQYYSLPVITLKCNKMIKFEDLDNFFPQLNYMFPSKEAIAQSGESEIEEPLFTPDELDIPNGDDINKTNQNGLKRSADTLPDAPPSKTQYIGGGNDAIIILD